MKVRKLFQFGISTTTMFVALALFSSLIASPKVSPIAINPLREKGGTLFGSLDNSTARLRSDHSREGH
jgi:hypothetical protein